MNRVKNFLYSQKVAPYVFVLPFVLTFCIFFVYPLLNTVLMSFETVLPGETTFVGFNNFKRLLNDKIFFKAVKNSFAYMVITCAILIPIPMMFACFINSKLMLFKELFKSVFFLPALTSVVVAGTIFRLAFAETPQSLMNLLAANFGIEGFKWLKNQYTGFAALTLLACWRWTGVNMLYFLSGLKGIPAELYESADIDGASNRQKFFTITMPLLKPTSVYVFTISIYAGLSMFTESMMIWGNNNSPQNIGLTIVGYLYRQGIEKNQLGYASAVGLVLFAIAMAFNLTQLNLTGTFKKEES